MIPNFAALIALYVLAQLTGLIDTHLALILIYVGGQFNEHMAYERVF